MSEQRKRRFYLEQHEGLLGIILVLPVLILLGIVVFYPLAISIILSFYRRSFFTHKLNFVFFRNYESVLSSPEFIKAFINTLIYTESVVFIQLALGMIIALFLNMSFKGRGILRTLVLLPWAIPTFAAAFIWRWMLDYRYGTINHILKFFHIVDRGIPWLESPSVAMIGVIVSSIWKLMPWTVVVLLAGLEFIPKEIEEASQIDGADRWQQFWHITLPQLRYVILIVLILRTMWTFNWFDFVYLVTGGGPAKGTLTLPIKLYDDAFMSYIWGRACATGTIMFFALLLLSAVYFHLFAKQTS